MKEKLVCNHDGIKEGLHIIHAPGCNEEKTVMENRENKKIEIPADFPKHNIQKA